MVQMPQILRFSIEDLWFTLGIGALAFVFTCAGALRAINPKLYVRVWRKIAFGDYSIRRPEWEATTTSYSGRLAGPLILCAGLLLFYLLFRVLRHM